MGENAMTMRTKKTRHTLLILIAGLALCVAGSASAQRTGHQQIDRLISRAESTVSQISLTRLQAQDTVDAYKALISGEGDSRRAFRDLNRELDRLDSQRERTRSRARRMESSAKELFAEWANSITKISSEELGATARTRLDDTRQRYDELIALGGEAGDAFDAFAASLRDQVVFVEHDLNEAALDSLREYSPTFDEKSQTLFRKINSVVGTASRLIESMRSP
jgi:HD superfamily phosphohydrolase